MLYLGSELRILLAGVTLFVSWCSDALRIIWSAQASQWTGTTGIDIEYNDVHEARIASPIVGALTYIESSLLVLVMLVFAIAGILVAAYGYAKESKSAKWTAGAFLVTALLLLLLRFTMGVFFNLEMINTGM